MLAPAGTPPAIVDQVQRDVAKILQDPAVRERFAALGAVPSGMTPAQFKQFMAAEATKWAKVVKQSGARVD
jgi:tripartite-type tricarboxylate transporter receptor subunit TctC